MYSKKYRLDRIEELNKQNPIYIGVEGNTCYLAYFKVGDRGWFLCEYDDLFDSVHRIHTSIVKDVEYFNDKVIVLTQNTRFTFTVINE